MNILIATKSSNQEKKMKASNEGNNVSEENRTFYHYSFIFNASSWFQLSRSFGSARDDFLNYLKPRPMACLRKWTFATTSTTSNNLSRAASFKRPTMEPSAIFHATSNDLDWWYSKTFDPRGSPFQEGPHGKTRRRGHPVREHMIPPRVNVDLFKTIWTAH